MASPSLNVLKAAPHFKHGYKRLKPEERIFYFFLL
jgi:hypothetical protein